MKGKPIIKPVSSPDDNYHDLFNEAIKSPGNENRKSKAVILLMDIGIPEEKAQLISDHYFEKTGSENSEIINRHCQKKTILNFLVECILQFKSFEKEIPVLIQYLTACENKLSRYDYGRLLHLKTLKSWKIDNDILFALQYLNNSIDVLKNLKSVKAKGYLARAYDTYGQLLTARGLLIEAREEFTKALCGRELINDLDGKAITLGNLGRLSMQLGDFENAIKYLKDDFNIVDGSNGKNANIRAQLLSTISICYLESGDLIKSREYNNLSYHINTESHNPVGLLFNSLNDANIAINENQSELALCLISKIKEGLKESQVHSFLKEYIRGRVLHLEARAMFLQNKFDEAHRCFGSALEIYNRELSISPIETANLLYDYAQLAIKFGNTTLAGKLYRKSLRCLDTTEEHKNRELIEAEMKSAFKDSWILHSAGRFLGHEQISFLLDEAGKGRYAGEEKEVAVLFTDVRGFTTLSEKLPSKQLLELLNRFLTVMTKSIETYGGFVDKFIGDSIMAVFSLPNPTITGPDNDSEKAVLAALMMIEELKRFNRNLPPDLPVFKIGIGIHIGVVTAGLIGSPQKRSYTVIGDVSNTASRLEGMTKMLGAQIIVSKQICDKFTRKNFIIRPLGRFCPKGRQNFVDVFEIMGLDDGSPKLQAIKNECKLAEKALNYFKNQEFDKAMEIYQQLISENKTNYRSIGYKILNKTCKRKINTPVAKHWKGEIALTQK